MATEDEFRSWMQGWVLTILALLVACIGVWHAFVGDWKAIAGCAMFACALLAFANLARLEYVYVGAKGVEARCRKLQEETEAKLSQLQSLAELVAGHLLGLTASITVLDDEEIRTRKRQQILSMLESLGTPATRRDELVRRFIHPLERWEYVDAIVSASPIGGASSTHLLRQASSDKPPSATQIRKWLADEGLANLTGTLALALDSLEHHERTGEHLYPELWERRDEWRHDG